VWAAASGVKIDVRVIAASNRDLEAAYRDGTFRKDLFFRLNVISVHLPPLRERKSDIPALVEYFFDRFSAEKILRMTNAAMKCLQQYDWPGNIRELENCIQRAVTLRNQDVIDVYDLPPALRPSYAAGLETEMPTQGAEAHTSDLEDLERITIQRVFEQVKGDKVLAGKILGISRATLYRKLKRYKLLKSTAISA